MSNYLSKYDFEGLFVTLADEKPLFCSDNYCYWDLADINRTHVLFLYVSCNYANMEFDNVEIDLDQVA